MKCLKGCRFLVGTAVLAGVVLASSAQAAIVYVDATTSNTAHAPSAGGGAWNAAAVGDTAGDNIWRLRANFGLLESETVPPSGAYNTTGGTIYESTGNSCCDDVPRVVTTVTAPAGLKDVYAYFWSDQNSSPWRIRAGLVDTVDPLPLFVSADANSVDTLGRDGANRRLWRAYLGQSSATSLAVYVDDAPATNGNERTWYDGVGYSVVPEPATGTLVCIALMGLGLIRRSGGKS